MFLLKFILALIPRCMVVEWRVFYELLRPPEGLQPLNRKGVMGLAPCSSVCPSLWTHSAQGATLEAQTRPPADTVNLASSALITNISGSRLVKNKLYYLWVAHFIVICDNDNKWTRILFLLFGDQKTKTSVWVEEAPYALYREFTHCYVAKEPLGSLLIVT